MITNLATLQNLGEKTPSESPSMDMAMEREKNFQPYICEGLGEQMDKHRTQNGQTLG
jgi:hypothetical protein